MGVQLLELSPVRSVQARLVRIHAQGAFPSDDSVSLAQGPFHVESAAAFSSDLRCLQAISRSPIQKGQNWRLLRK